MSGLPYRAVFFDVGETLLAPHPSFNELFSEIMGGLGYEVTPDDVGKDPVTGELVRSSAQEIVIKRADPKVGDVHVHFPRAGFVVAPA